MQANCLAPCLYLMATVTVFLGGVAQAPCSVFCCYMLSDSVGNEETNVRINVLQDVCFRALTGQEHLLMQEIRKLIWLQRLVEHVIFKLYSCFLVRVWC